MKLLKIIVGAIIALFGAYNVIEAIASTVSMPTAVQPSVIDNGLLQGGIGAVLIIGGIIIMFVPVGRGGGE